MENVRRWPENEEKFKELILYISQKCADDPTFGATKLNKILFYSDFIAYAIYGKPITGFEYQKLPNGPAPRKLVPIREQMIEDRELGFQEIPLRIGHIQKRTVNLRPPNLSLFSGPEIALIDQVIETLCGVRTKVVSEFTHRIIGWKVVKNNETIPYETVFLCSDPLTEEDIARGQELADQYGWKKTT